MKHRKRLCAGFVAAVLVVGAAMSALGASGTVEAAENVPQAVPLSAAAPDHTFSDVPANAWYADAVSWCWETGILSGTSASTFGPSGTMTRAMLATVIYRMADSPAAILPPAFSDVPANSWYTEAVAWVSENGLIAGYGNRMFGAEDPVTREQIATILWRYDGSTTAAVSAEFTDAASISNYAMQAVDWAAEQGIVAGREGNRFDPQASATRAEVAMILYRYLTRDDSEEAPPPESDNDNPAVYMTTDISADSLIAIYEALEASPTGNIAVKLSTGEPGSNYLRTDLIGPLVQSFDDPTIVECNTAYGGQRANTAMHYQVAEDHGYTAIADVDIMDENGSMTLPVEGGTNLTENYVGANFANYDYFVVLSHFKGHAMAGYGGAIKNISIGIASADGKAHIHSGGTGGSMWGGDQDAFLESMAEAGKSVVDALDGNILYINVMNRLSVDCDCDGNPAEPDMHDIGILASYDPVALDQACIDLVYAAEDGGSLVNRIESRNGLHTLEHAEAIGLGSREYNLVSLDG